MAEKSQDAQDAVQSNAETTAKREGGVTGKGFRKGQSGNPAGRPRSLSRRVREVVGDDGDPIVRLWAATTSGYLVCEHPVTRERSYEKVSVGDRLNASKLIAAYGWGKPPEFAPMEEVDPLERGLDTRRLAERFEDELAARRQRLLDRQRGEAADG